MERMHRILLPYIQNSPPFSNDTPGSWNHPDTLRTEVDWETSKEQTRSVLEKLLPKYAQIFDHSFAYGNVKVTDVIAGHGGGGCNEKGIDYRRDGTINDVIYLTHEFGHYIPVHVGSLDQPSLINEWQAFFMQYAQLHALTIDHEWGEEIAESAKNHQKQDLLLMLGRFSDALHVLSNLKNGKVEKPERQQALLYTQQPHYHGTASFIGLALFNKYKNSSPEEQRRMRTSLFETTAETSYESVLGDFDLIGPRKLESTIQEELNRIGLTPPTSQTLKHRGNQPS